jgi:hypothetical protein
MYPPVNHYQHKPLQKRPVAGPVVSVADQYAALRASLYSL